MVELHDNGYGRSLGKLNELFNKAKADFPSLQIDYVDIVVFGGISKKGIMGLHFKAPEGALVPGEYVVVKQRERIQ